MVPTVPTPTVPAPTGGSGGSPVSSPSPQPVPDLDRTALESAPVPALCGHPAGRLRQGRLSGVPDGEGEVSLAEVVLGDLDRDGEREAAAVVTCSQGNGVSDNVLVYAAGPRLVGRVPIGEGLDSEVQGQQVVMGVGTLQVSGAFQDGDDARCCPSGRVVRQYRVSGGRVVRVPGPGLEEDARLTGGDGWSTVRVGADYEELARATGYPVTLQVLDDEEDPAEASCAYVTLLGFDGVEVLGGHGRVRALTFGQPGVLTGAGVGVGSTEQEVLAAYGPRATRADNVYSAVPDIVLLTGDDNVVRFEFDEDRTVSQMHAGQGDYASLPEGCA